MANRHGIAILLFAVLLVVAIRFVYLRGHPVAALLSVLSVWLVLAVWIRFGGRR
jgi:hypothetical protein